MERFAAALLEAAPDAVVLVDGRGTIRLVNRRTEELFGYARDELLGRPVELLVPERLRDVHVLHRAGFAGAPRVREMGVGLDLCGRRRDGSEFPVEIGLSPVEEGGEALVLTIVRDVSERRELERARREAREAVIWAHLARIVDSSRDAIFSKDLDGIVLTWNAAAEALYGYPASEIVGRSVELLLPDDRPDEVRELLERLRRGEPIDRLETRRRTRTGHEVDVELTISPIRDEAGDVIGASTIARDVSARKAIEARRAQAQKMETLGRLTGGVAHDVNNMLTAIVGFGEFALDARPDEDVAQHVRSILRVTDGAAELTRRLLAFSRQQVLEPQRINLNEVVESAMLMLQRVVGGRVRVEKALDPTLRHVLADPIQVEQVLLNLLVNARDAMPDGGTAIVETGNAFLDGSYASFDAAVEPGWYALLAVSDDGVGMDRDTRTRIFDPFFTTKEVGQGTGLGLATVYGIVRQSGGHIWCYSEPGEGTVFKLYLPLAPSAVESAPTCPGASWAGARGSETILVVEDDPTVRDLMRRALADAGYRVLEASDGCDAIGVASAHEEPLHLLVTDVIMPGLRGPDLAAWLGEDRPGTRTVFVSGFAGQSVAHHGLLRRADRFLAKPFTPSALRAAVRQVLDGA